MLQLGTPESWYTSKAEVSELLQLLQEKMYGQDCDLVAVRQMYAFQSGVPFTERVYGLVCEVAYAYQTNTAKLRQGRQLKHGHVRELQTILLKSGIRVCEQIPS